MSEDKSYGFITLNYFARDADAGVYLSATFGKTLDEAGDVKPVVDELRDQLATRLETENKASELTSYDEWLTEL